MRTNTQHKIVLQGVLFRPLLQIPATWNAHGLPGYTRKWKLHFSCPRFPVCPVLNSGNFSLLLFKWSHHIYVVCITDVSKSWFHLQLLPSGYSNQDIQHAGNTALSRRHRWHKTGFNRREIPKLEAPQHLFMFRRLFNAASPDAQYLNIPEAFVVFFKLESLHSSWTSEVTHKTEASVWIKSNQTEIRIGYLSAEICRYIILLYRGCWGGGGGILNVLQQDRSTLLEKPSGVTAARPGILKKDFRFLRY